MLFMDEAKINIADPDCGKVFVKMSDKSKKKPECQKKKIKFGGGKNKIM